MMKIKNGLAVFLLALCFVFSAHAQNTGPDTFPLHDVDKNIPSTSHPKVIVFLPGLTTETEYASMVVQAFKNYFVDKLAFRSQDRSQVAIDIILVTQDASKGDVPLPAKNAHLSKMLDSLLLATGDEQSYFDTRGMIVHRMIGNSLRQNLQLPTLTSKNDDAVLFLLDGNNRIVWRDDQYRGQGEHLKPLEYKVKALLNLPVPQVVKRDVPSLTVGQSAPDVALGLGEKVSNLRGEILVLTFYPAAFSGVLNTQDLARRQSMERMAMMSCSMQIRSLDAAVLPGGQRVRYYALSESTPELLQRWKDILLTHEIEYINDSDYSAAQAYGAYGAYDAQQGYNRRVTAIIDQQGKIAYLNQDYKLETEKQIQKVLEDLSSKTKP